MKLHFEADLDYQQAAVEAVVGLFKGQEINRTEFTVTSNDTSPWNLGLIENELGIGNRRDILDEEILDNLRKIQLRNGIPIADSLESGNFTVEMETGTGKTYVYLRTIFELNKHYGFTKFVIVVPSVAIKEGTYKTLQITAEHFGALYPMAKGYTYFQYDSSKPDAVRNFAMSPNIQIMIVTVGAINKQDVNNLYKENEKTGWEKPIDLVRETNPIIIVDEPQSVDGGMKGRGREALSRMRPLCTLRYSATHVDKFHMVYRLNAVDAYDRKLVKQIEVAALEVEGGHNKPYVKMLSSVNRGGSITAKIEVDAINKGDVVSRCVKTVKDGDDLRQITERDIYENYAIGTINVGADNQSIELKTPHGDRILRPGDEEGEVNTDAITRMMIRQTIKAHLDKEKRFMEQKRDIKVLSLFFINDVSDYRIYNEDREPIKGRDAIIFEEEYRNLANSDEYQTLFTSADLNVEEVHEGYFSIDRKGGWVNTDDNNEENRNNAERAYNLIMRDKEKLLSFVSKLKFIFSHSALREGWDNPNVFQICALRNIGTDLARRQTLGRGLRLCVNQQGERIRGFETNTLTVVAKESYEAFAENLQKEIEQDTGIRFGVIEKDQFANLGELQDDGKAPPIGLARSEEIWRHLKAKGYIDGSGRIQDVLRTALETDSVEIPEEYAKIKEGIENVLRGASSKIEVKNARERITIPTREAVIDSAEFRELWDRVKYKTTYRVHFDNAGLIEECITAINEGPGVSEPRARFKTANIAIGQAGVEVGERGPTTGYTKITEADVALPDILTDLQDKTQLTRKSLVKILTGINRLEDFKKNPQEFIDLATEAIKRTKSHFLVDGVKYQPVGNDHYYAQELFKQEELTGYLQNTVEAQKSVHEKVVYNGGVEKSFAENLELNEAIKVYAKLPVWFKIYTPLGSYNPDWAVLVDDAGKERLYFVVETKASNWLDDLRAGEEGKIKCGKKHFESIATGDRPAQYITATSVDDMLRQT